MATRGERSAQTRARLLDAAIDCLVEYGYAGTTTPKVAARAGLTRGAQVHHFGTKADMVVAAVDHLSHKRIEAAARDIGSPQDVTDPAAGAANALNFIWDVHQGPLFVAAAELWLAARTDDALSAAFASAEPSVHNAMVAALTDAIPATAAHHEFHAFVTTAMDALRGILISGFIEQDIARTRRRWARVCASLVTIAPDLRAG